MSRSILVILVLNFLASVHAMKLTFSEVVPFPETKPTTEEFELALKFKPQLYVRRGCYPYAAVDSEGNTNGGIAGSFISWARKCGFAYGETKGSQIYGRSAEVDGMWAIMYAWYFPKDTAFLPYFIGWRRHGWEHVIVWLDDDNATIAAVSASSILNEYTTYAPPNANTLNGTSIQMELNIALGTNHYLKTTPHWGRFQDLVMWDDMTEDAREALNTADFGVVDVPINDDNFMNNVKKANPNTY